MSMTFTKLFSSITDSSIWCQDDHTRLVWITMLAMADKHGRVWAAVPGLAARARVPVEAAERALAIFLAPDPHSRTKDFDGRRIEGIDGGWRLLNHGKYRALRDVEDQRTKDAERQRRCRAKRGGDAVTPMSRNVTPSHDNADADADADAEAKRGRRAPRFSPPTAGEVRQEAEKIGLPESEADKFHDHYTANGWLVGRSPMKDWKAALRNWQRRNDSPGTKGTNHARISSNPRNAGTY